MNSLFQNWRPSGYRRYPERNLKVIKMRDKKKMTFTKIGETLGITPQHARYIYVKGPATV